MSESSCYRLLLAYRGTAYHGWQVQPGLRTAQGELARALLELTAEAPEMAAAGRIDAGAHAHGQVVSIRLQRRWEAAALLHGCNARLPRDLSLLRVEEARPDFHPRFGAWRRTYRYLVRDTWAPAPVAAELEWWVPQALELAPMEEAGRLLLGRHDFAAFGRSPQPGGSTVRTVDRAEVARAERLVVLEVRADAFLRGMMRSLAGALVAVGRGRLSPEELGRALSDPAGTRRSWSTAPARGLHQWRVDYGAGLAEVAV